MVEGVVVRQQVSGAQGGEEHEREGDGHGQHGERQHEPVGRRLPHLLRVLGGRQRQHAQREGVGPPRHAEPPHRALEQRRTGNLQCKPTN